MKKILFQLLFVISVYNLYAQNCLVAYQNESTSEYCFANSLLNPSDIESRVIPQYVKVYNTTGMNQDYNTFTYLYDEFGRVVSKKIVLNISGIEQTEKFVYADDKLLKKETWAWQNDKYIIKKITNYIVVLDTLREIFFEYPDSSEVKNNLKYLYEYSDGLLKRVIWQKEDLQGWKNYKKDEFIYAQNSFLLDWITSEYDSSISAWRKSKKISYSYDSSNLLTDFCIYKFVYGLWRDIVEFTASYNSENQLDKFQGYIDDDPYYIFIGYNNTKDCIDISASYTYAPSPHMFSISYPYYTFLRSYFNNKVNYLDFYTNSVNITYQTFTDVSDETIDVKDYYLSQNYPNPFNPSTTINFSLPKQEHVTLKIYDILGKEVSTLVDEDMSSGNHSKIWNAENLSSGVYFYKLQAGSFSETKKMLLVR